MRSNSEIFALPQTSKLALFVTGLGILLAPQPAQAMKLSLVGVGTMGQVSIAPASQTSSGSTSSLSSTSKLGFGGGVLLGFGFSPMLEFETGALYVTRKYGIVANISTPVAGIDTFTYTGHSFFIPAVLKLNLLSMMSLSAGGYAAVGTGKMIVEETGIAGVSAASTTSKTYSEAGLNNQDYGLLFGLGFKIPLAPMTALRLDGRYAYGLKDVDADKSDIRTYKARDIQVQAGLQFGF